MASRLDCVPTSLKRTLRLPLDLIVPEEHRRAVVGRHQQIDVAVPIEVAAGEATTDPWLSEAAARKARDVAKRGVPLVEEEQWRLCVSDIAPDVADRFIDVAVGHDQIEAPVEIQIGKDAAEAQACERGDADP